MNAPVSPTRGRALLQGAAVSAPVAAGVIPFAVVMAVSALDAGMTPLRIVGLSVVVFAGASQLTAVELLKAGAPAALIIAGAVIVNLRFIVYSASLGQHLEGEGKALRGLMSYLLTDQAYALSLKSGDQGALYQGSWFYLGAALALWLCWQGGTALGIALGSSLPPSWSMDFSAVLAFVALTVPHLHDKPALLAALVSVLVFLAAAALPYGLALLPATGAGMLTGVVVERGRS